MKTALILSLVLFTFPIFGTEVELPEKTVFDEIHEIIDVMVNLEDRLHDDRHDLVVQLQGKEIEDRIEKLIKDIEDDDKDEENGKPRTRTKIKPSEAKIPMKDSKLKRQDVPAKVIPREQMAWDTQAYHDWARLQDLKRDSILQSYHEELPARWKKRLEAYFLSINAEEIAVLDAKMKARQAWLKKRLIEQDIQNKKAELAGRKIDRVDFPLNVPEDGKEVNELFPPNEGEEFQPVKETNDS
jgi:hypothetical protein